MEAEGENEASGKAGSTHDSTTWVATLKRTKVTISWVKNHNSAMDRTKWQLTETLTGCVDNVGIIEDPKSTLRNQPLLLTPGPLPLIRLIVLDETYRDIAAMFFGTFETVGLKFT
jgi:hypothetical protein